MQLIVDIVDENAKTQEKNLENLNIDVSGKIEDINLDFKEMGKENKRLIKTTLQARQTANSNRCDSKDLQKKVEGHYIHQDQCGKFIWKWRSYPILKTDKNNHWSKYNVNLKDIKLEGDLLQQLHNFWYAIDTALTSTLNSNKGLGDYKDLTEYYSVKESPVPPQGHTQHNEGEASYNNFTSIIRDHLF